MSPTAALRPSVIVGLAAVLASTLSITIATAGGASADRGNTGAGKTVVVRPGDSIQAALDAARPGDRIVVRPGTYAEQLTIGNDAITLVGQAAVLVPPATSVINTCSGLAGDGTEAGICVSGSGVSLAPFVAEHRRFISVGKPVDDVVVRGFEVRGFSGPNVALVGASDATIEGNRLVDGNAYGAVSVGSVGTNIVRNIVTAGPEVKLIGICTDDVAPSIVSQNEVSGYIVGLCVQTQGADYRSNDIHDNCIGVYVDPGVGALVRGNRIAANNGPCDAFGFINGIGVFLDGTIGTEVVNNKIFGHQPTGFGAALVLADGAEAMATGNTVKRNTFVGNSLDILMLSQSIDNVFARNRCTTSNTPGLCA